MLFHRELIAFRNTSYQHLYSIISNLREIEMRIGFNVFNMLTFLITLLRARQIHGILLLQNNSVKYLIDYR